MNALQETGKEPTESLAPRGSAQQKEAINPAAVPRGFESAADNLLRAVSDSINPADCGIAGDPGTATALCWEAGEGKAPDALVGDQGLTCSPFWSSAARDIGRTGPGLPWWGLGNSSSKSEG